MSTLGAPSPISNHLAHAHAYAPPSVHNSYSYNFYMNPPSPIQYTHTQPHHGTKRSAPDDELESPAAISTHFKKLRLNQAQLPPPTALSPVGVSLRAGNHTTSQHPSASQHVQYSDTHPNTSNLHHSNGSNTNQTTIHPPTAEDFMPIDDTPSRIYIHDLDSEIAAIEALEPKTSTFLLPDFDKNVSRIPHNVLRQKFDTIANGSSNNSNHSGSNSSQALVLYREPISISVPPEEDVVRKAIIEARKVAREKMKREYEEQYRSHSNGDTGNDTAVAGGVTGMLHTIHEVPSHDDEVVDMDDHMDDPDAMDIG